MIPSSSILFCELNTDEFHMLSVGKSYLTAYNTILGDVYICTERLWYALMTSVSYKLGIRVTQNHATLGEGRPINCQG